MLVGQSVGAVAALSAALRAPHRAAGVVLATRRRHRRSGADRDRARRPLRGGADPLLDRLLSPRLRRAEPAKTFLFQQMGTFNVPRWPT